MTKSQLDGAKQQLELARKQADDRALEVDQKIRRIRSEHDDQLSRHRRHAEDQLADSKKKAWPLAVGAP